MPEQSDFGRGLVICLVKFAEHFENHLTRDIYQTSQYISEPPDQRDLSTKPTFLDPYIKIYKTEENVLSHLIQMWANGATDHLYDITVPKKWQETELGTKIRLLQKLGLEIGHGFTGKTYRIEHLNRLHQLTREIALLIDQSIGLKQIADLGEW